MAKSTQWPSYPLDTAPASWRPPRGSSAAPIRAVTKRIDTVTTDRIPVSSRAARAWFPPPGCFRIVEEEDGSSGARPCLGPVIRSGWRCDDFGQWHRIEACIDHESEMSARPTQEA
jgi:hypothetical protein